MKFNFDWTIVTAGAPYVTISETALGFNLPSVALLNNAENVIVGYDQEAAVIGVKPYDGTPNVKSYSFSSRVKNGWVRIGCKDFIRHLSSLTGLSFTTSKRYIAQYDDEEGVLYINVKEPERF